MGFGRWWTKPFIEQQEEKVPRQRQSATKLERRNIFSKLVSRATNTSSRVNKFRNYQEYNVPIHDLSILPQNETSQVTIYLALHILSHHPSKILHDTNKFSFDRSQP